MKACGFKSIDKFPQCKKIREIYLSGNNLGTLLGIETRFPSLESLDIRENQFPHVQQLQQELCRSEHLEILFVSGNPLCDLNSNYVKVLSVHVSNLKLIDEISVNEDNVFNVEQYVSNPLIAEFGYKEQQFDEEEMMQNIKKKQEKSIKEADEVKTLFMNLEKHTRKLEKTFESSLASLDSTFNEFKRDISTGMLSENLSERTYSPEERKYNLEHIDKLELSSAFSSQTFDTSDLRRSIQMSEQKKIPQSNESIESRAKKSLNNMERIKAAQQYSRDSKSEDGRTEKSEADDMRDIAQFINRVNHRTAEKKRPPSAQSGAILKPKRNIK